MAGTLKVDTLNADSNLALKIANTAVAFIDSNGLRPTSGNVSLDATGTTGVRSPAANTLVSYTGGVERVRVDSSGNVGVGEASTGGKLHVYQSDATQPALQLKHGDGDFILMEETGGTDLFKFTRVAGTNNLAINNLTANAIKFYTNNTERLSIPGDAAGITFPATQAASTDANTLDDYEEGTFTPVVTGSSSNPTITYSQQTGVYTKVGNWVYVSIQLGLTNRSGGSGTWQVSLPFTSLSDNVYYGGYIGTIYGFSHSGSQNQWGCRIATGDNKGQLWEFAGSGGADNAVGVTQQGTGQCYLTISYMYRV